MTAPGEIDLATIMSTIDVVRRTGAFVYVVRAPSEPPPPDALAMVNEGSSVTYVVPMDSPAAMGSRFRAAWLTLTVQTSLDAVGLSAAVAKALAERSIPANLLAGFYHDHLLVPLEMVDDAMSTIRGLAAR